MNAALRQAVEAMGATVLPWGERAFWPVDFGAIEAEYAALRRGCALLPGGHVALLEVTGRDRGKWLNGLATQKLDDLKPGDVRRSFFLDAEGHILADVRVIASETALYLDLDANDAAPMRTYFERMLFAEDCQVRQVEALRVSALGPAALKFLGDTEETQGLLRYRADECGVPAFHMWGVDWSALIARSGWHLPAANGGARPVGTAAPAARPVGWEAFNTARVEAGQMRFHLDFGPDSLPAETGTACFAEAVHMKKGCYPGQEAVARMHSLGHPKRVCVALKADLLPEVGTLLLESDEAKRAIAARGGQVGVVTSAALSPLHGAEPRMLGVVKWGLHTAGSRVALAGGGVGEVVA